MSPPDYSDHLEDDVAKVKRLTDGDMDTSVPALIELGFGVAFAIVGVVWFVAMWWVPDVISGTQWFGFGMLGVLLFGLPGGLIYVLRRGGARVIQSLVRQVVG